jgi:hypothetical protein
VRIHQISDRQEFGLNSHPRTFSFSSNAKACPNLSCTSCSTCPSGESNILKPKSGINLLPALVSVEVSVSAIPPELSVAGFKGECSATAVEFPLWIENGLREGMRNQDGRPHDERLDPDELGSIELEGG